MVKPIIEYPEEEYILPGTRLCAGCGLQIAYRWALKALGPNTIMANPASCSTVCGGVGGYTPIKTPIMYCCFETAAATTSGIAAALSTSGKDKEINAVAWAGDGGTYDIGIQGLSGASERGENIIYVCYNNQAYMNTGIQRSSATPYGATTTTTPFSGKSQISKNIPAILAAHGISYVATCSSSHPLDIYDKFTKAKEFNGKGVRYIEILSSCPPGWGHKVEESVEMCRLAVETGYWVLFERIEGKLILSPPSRIYRDKSKRKNIRAYLTRQSRFKHFTDKEYQVWEQYIEEQWRDIEWELLRQNMQELV